MRVNLNASLVKIFPSKKAFRQITLSRNNTPLPGRRYIVAPQFVKINILMSADGAFSNKIKTCLKTRREKALFALHCHATLLSGLSIVKMFPATGTSSYLFGVTLKSPDNPDKSFFIAFVLGSRRLAKEMHH